MNGIVQFANLHVFSYSKRAGTPAAVMPQQVPESVKKLRHRRLEELSEVMKNDFRNSLKNQILPVIFETVDRHGIAPGWSDNYIAVTAAADTVQLGKITDHQL